MPCRLGIVTNSANVILSKYYIFKGCRPLPPTPGVLALGRRVGAIIIIIIISSSSSSIISIILIIILIIIIIIMISISIIIIIIIIIISSV